MLTRSSSRFNRLFLSTIFCFILCLRYQWRISLAFNCKLVSLVITEHISIMLNVLVKSTLILKNIPDLSIKSLLGQQEKTQSGFCTFLKIVNFNFLGKEFLLGFRKLLTLLICEELPTSATVSYPVFLINYLLFEVEPSHFGLFSFGEYRQPIRFYKRFFKFFIVLRSGAAVAANDF